MSVTANIKCTLVNDFFDYLDGIQYGLCPDLALFESYSDLILYLDNPTTSLNIKYNVEIPVVGLDEGPTALPDNDPPYPLSFNPINGSTNVDTALVWELVFNEPITLNTGSISVYDYSNDSLVVTYNVGINSQIYSSGSTLYINATSAIQTGSQYYVLIDSGVIKDVSGNSWTGISSKTVWNFNTVVPNTVPVITNLQIVGTLASGQTLTETSTYTDAQGDLAGTHIVKWYSYTDALGTLNETLLATANSYVLTFAEVGKTIRVKKTPVAQTGASPGLEVTSSVSAVVLNEIILTFTTTKQTAFTFNLNTNGSSVYINWGDGTNTTGSTTSGTWIASPFIKTYSTPGTRTINIHGTKTSMLGFICATQNLTGTLDISKLENLTQLEVNNNSLTTLLHATSTAGLLTKFYLNDNSFTSLNLAAYKFAANAFLYLYNLASLTSITWPTTPTNYLGQLYFYNNTSYTSALSLSTFTPGITSLTLSYTRMSSLTLPTTTHTMTSLQLIQCTSLVGLLDLTPVSNLSGQVRTDSCTLITTINYPTNSQAFSLINHSSNTGLTTLNMNGLTGLFTGTFTLNNCTAITTLNLPNPSGGAVTSLTLSSVQVAYTYNLKRFTYGTSGISISAVSCQFTAAEINEVLVDLDTDLAIGTGTVTLNGGTNSAPDTTSGGFNGVAARSNLAIKGYTVITN